MFTTSVRLAAAWLAPLALCLGACSHTPPIPAEALAVPESLFSDAHFAAPTVPVASAPALALTPAMARYLETTVRPQVRRQGARQALLEALFNRKALKLDYDDSVTRTAGEAFDARRGNCLSLLLMTATFAGELGVPVQFRQVMVAPTWARERGVTLLSNHVNLALAEPRAEGSTRVLVAHTADLVVDFLPQREMGRQHAREVALPTVLAMYLNNRAAELLLAGRLDDAYWWVREALHTVPRFTPALSTLALVYLRRGLPEQADAALRLTLAREPEQLNALHNRVAVLDAMGRHAQARALAAQVAARQPDPPFHHFDLGLAAMRAGRFADARDAFAREIRRQPTLHELHHWLAMANWGLRDVRGVRAELERALQLAETDSQRLAYGAKLDALRKL